MYKYYSIDCYGNIVTTLSLYEETTHWLTLSSCSMYIIAFTMIRHYLALTVALVVDSSLTK